MIDDASFVTNLKKHLHEFTVCGMKDAHGRRERVNEKSKKEQERFN